MESTSILPLASPVVHKGDSLHHAESVRVTDVPKLLLRASTVERRIYVFSVEDTGRAKSLNSS